MSGQHTPGPWVVYDTAPYDPSWELRFEVWAGTPGGDDDGDCLIAERLTADHARIIAAAPDLLAVCKRLAAVKHDGGVWLYWRGELMYLVPDAVLSDAEAAIAKATGESNG